MAAEVLLLAKLVVDMLKPFVSGAASGVAEAAGAKLYDLLQRKFAGDPEATLALNAFSTRPDRYRGALVDVIAEKVRTDPGFADQLHTLIVRYDIYGDYVEGDKVLGDKVGTKFEQKFFMGLLTASQIRVLVILSLVLQWIVYAWSLCSILNVVNLVMLLPCVPIVWIIAGFGWDAGARTSDKKLKRLSILSGLSPFIYGLVLAIVFSIILALGVGTEVLKGILPTPTP